MKVIFKDWKCNLIFGAYSNGRTAISLIDAEDNSPIATASVNLPDEPLTKDEIAIKDYSENEGMLDALVEAGIVSKPIRFVRSGWVAIPVCILQRS